MAKKSQSSGNNKSKTRAARKLGNTGLKLLVMGGMLVVLPAFLGRSPINQGLASLRPIGWLMLAAGIVFLVLAKKSGGPGAPQEDVAAGREGQRSTAAVARKAVPLSTSPAAPETRKPRVEAPRPPPAASQATSAATQAPQERPSQWGKPVFDVIEWRRFEAVVERLFQQAGFITTAQSHGADEGVDVWLYSRHQPGEPVSMVQCKHWQGKRVGVDKIRELRGVMAARNVKRGQFATTSTFTPDAIAFARENGVNLLDVEGLLALIAQRTPEQQAELLQVALECDYWRPTCVNCGVKMVDRASRKDGSSFWGCPTYPRCKTTMAMRAA